MGNNVEIGCNNTIDRGSLSNTIIGDGTFLDNQVHVAHNVKIGKNCIITGQVGFAGSSKIGNRVMIGGQAGISGHLNPYGLRVVTTDFAFLHTLHGF